MLMGEKQLLTNASINSQGIFKGNQAYSTIDTFLLPLKSKFPSNFKDQINARKIKQQTKGFLTRLF